MQTNCILIASNFVIHPQVLIFSVFEISSFPILNANIFNVTVLYLFTFAINLWHQKFVTADFIAVIVHNDEDTILIKTHKYTQHTQLHAYRN